VATPAGAKTRAVRRIPASGHHSPRIGDPPSIMERSTTARLKEALHANAHLDALTRDLLF
jgi:hypothetical protein